MHDCLRKIMRTSSEGDFVNDMTSWTHTTCAHAGDILIDDSMQGNSRIFWGQDLMKHMFCSANNLCARSLHIVPKTTCTTSCVQFFKEPLCEWHWSRTDTTCACAGFFKKTSVQEIHHTCGGAILWTHPLLRWQLVCTFKTHCYPKFVWAMSRVHFFKGSLRMTLHQRKHHMCMCRRRLCKR